jgi:uncharacterized protein (TIGR02145 family)
LSNDDDWARLTDYLGGEEVAGGKLKATGTIEEGTGLWSDPNTGATNETGFTALPGGDRFNGAFYDKDGGALWWSPTEYEEENSYAMFYYLLHRSSDISKSFYPKETGLSVRCVKY